MLHSLAGDGRKPTRCMKWLRLDGPTPPNEVKNGNPERAAMLSLRRAVLLSLMLVPYLTTVMADYPSYSGYSDYRSDKITWGLVSVNQTWTHLH